jgi:quercetin dioxygenase-like cupin family protein
MALLRSPYLVAVLVASASIHAVHAQSDGSRAVEIFPDQILWGPPLPTGGQAAVLSGPLDKPVLYAQRVRLPQDGMVPPHTHPDTRYITVLSGELYAGRGETMEAQKTTRYPAGSYFVVPAGVVHYSWARNGEVVYQESGIGPTTTDFIKK